MPLTKRIIFLTHRGGENYEKKLFICQVSINPFSLHSCNRNTFPVVFMSIWFHQPSIRLRKICFNMILVILVKRIFLLYCFTEIKLFGRYWVSYTCIKLFMVILEPSDHCKPFLLCSEFIPSILPKKKSSFIFERCCVLRLQEVKNAFSLHCVRSIAYNDNVCKSEMF